MSNTIFTTVNINEQWFYGIRKERRRNGISLGPITIQLEHLTNNPGNFGARPTQCYGIVLPTPVGHRKPTAEPISGFNTKDLKDVDKGHLFALCNGGPEASENIVPQWSKWQRAEEWRKIEESVHKDAGNIMDGSKPSDYEAPTKFVFFGVKVGYVSTGTLTPTFVRWCFPSVFSITAYVCDINRNKIGDFLSYNGRQLKDYRLDGGPTGL